MRLHQAVFAMSLSAALCACASAQLMLPESQISMYVREVFQDRDGVFWFGTNGEGVCRYDGKSLTYLSTQEGLAGGAIRGILQDEGGAMWFATDGGVSRCQNGKFTNYTMENGLSDNSVWCIMRDQSGTIWVGTHEGVCRFNGKAFVPFPLPRVEVEKPESRFTPKVVFAMFQDQAGDIWFGTDGEGVQKFDGQSFTAYTTKDGLAGNMVRSVYGDRRGQIWIGSDGGGVSRFDGKTFRNFTTKDGLSGDRVYEILQDRAGNMWFSTLGAGACRYDGKTFTPFGVEQGLIINDLACPCGSGLPYGNCHGPGGGHVQEFFEDRDGNLWLGCSGGLFRLEGDRLIHVTPDGPWPKPKQESTSAKSADPMASFARMIPGEWRVTYQSGKTQFDRWSWGPGKHSTLTQTYGTDAGGDPWRELQILYWHPARRQVCLLSLHPDIPGIGRGVGEGTIKMEGDSGEAVYDLNQPGHLIRPIRQMAFRWTFANPDSYRETLLEDTGNGFGTLVAWDYARSTNLSPYPPVAEASTRPTGRLQFFEPLVGHTWQAAGRWASGETLEIQTTFEWIPYVEAIVARVVAPANGSQPAPLLQACLYHHPRTDQLHCLALNHQGAVYECQPTEPEPGTLHFDLLGYQQDRRIQYAMELKLEKDGTLRQRLWTVEGSERTLKLDVQHKKRGPEQD